MKFEDIEVEDVDFGAMLEESFKKSDSSSDLVDGIIVKIDEEENQVVVDVGRKNEAFMSLDQIRDEDGNIMFENGETITVVITGFRGERPNISYELAEKRAALAEFIEEYDDEEEYIIEGEITKKNKGGFVVDVSGLEFFMPRTLSYISHKINPIGKKVKALIVKVDKEKGSVVVSRKELIEREKAETQEIVDKLLENKAVVLGVIKKITSYGMFVDVGGMDGLVHYSQISHKGPVNPSKYYKEDDEVNVVAIDYDKKKRHLSLSIKEASIDPWKDIDNTLRAGDTVNVTVSNIEPYGAFVDLGEDLEAFLHVSEISWDKNVKHPKDYIEIDQQIDVEIIEIDKIQRRLRVSRKTLLPKPIDQFASANRTNDVITGTVSSITDFGAFVKIGAVEGLLHNQEISWDKGINAKDVLKKGDEVEVKIIKIDRANGKVSLSKKALEPSPVSKFAKEHKNGDIVEGTVKDKKDFGIFVSIEPGVDALLRLDDLGPLKEDEIEKGQAIRAVISFLDAKNDRIRISVRRLERQEEREALDQLNAEQDDSMTLGDVFKDQLKKRRR
ncbi:30S ribosomal protein S1 [Sulfurovum sp. bin170]|uniref:30S ribosomal protein S1 n=1 Tax=Sulfurovum sp. bin170 TaxID=2695268 RepID=UPI0013E0D1E2|nr:30S ribosomal protein S1 [Sulfurovum sp. bin170]NEW59828.1 30S ribosomal protein S1 [Sulfurovum sp. bin170]